MKSAANEEYQSKVFLSQCVHWGGWLKNFGLDWLRLNQISRKTTGATWNWGADPSIPSKISANSMLSQGNSSSKTADKGNLFLLACKKNTKVLLPRHRIWVFHKYKWFHVRDDGRSLLWASVNGPSPVFPWLLIPPMMLRFVLVIIVIITKLFPTSTRHRHSFPSHLRTSRSH